MKTSQTQFTIQNFTGKILGIFVLVFSLFIFSHSASARTFTLPSDSNVIFNANINSGTYSPGENISITGSIDSSSPIADSAYLNATTNSKIVSIIPGGTNPNATVSIYNGYSLYRTVNINTTSSDASLFAPNAIGNYAVTFTGGVNEAASPYYFDMSAACFSNETYTGDDPTYSRTLIHGNNGDTIVIGATFAGQVFGSGNSPYYYHGAFNGFNLNGVASIPVSSSTSYAWNTSWQPGGPDIYNYNPYDVPSFPLNLSMPDISVPIFANGYMAINTKAALYNNNRYQGNVQLLLTVKSITHNGSPYYGPLPPPYSVCYGQNQ